MKRTISLFIGLIAVALGCVAAHAQDHGRYQVLIDADGDPATGCSIQPSGGGMLSGQEVRLSATVDLDTLEVVHVARETCRGGAFTGIGSGGGGYPVALNAGVSGGDSIELAADRAAIGLGQAPIVALTFVADNAEGSDVIATADGSPGGAAVHLGLPVQVPALFPWALAGLAVALLLLARPAHRRLGRIGSVCLVMGVATLAWAMHFAADGVVSDWSGMAPAATDPSGDATDGSSTADLLAALAAVENGVLYFRLDVVDIENRIPEAGGDAYAVDEDTPLDIAAPGVLDNDNDADGDALSAVVASGPDHAANFTLHADGGFSYEPETDFNGEDTFTYRASDGGLESDPATVTITIGAVNDAPQAADDGFSVEEDSSDNPLDVLANDSDAENDPLTIDAVAAPDQGGTASTGGNTITYTPAPDFSGTETFTYTVADGNGGTDTATVTVTVNGTNDPPEPADDLYTTAEDTTLSVSAPGVLGNDSDVDGDDLTAILENGPAHFMNFSLSADGSFSYQPLANFNGTDSFSYRVSDGTVTSAPVTVTITVNPVNDAPGALDDTAAVTEEAPNDSADNTVSGNVLSNDSDIDSAVISVSAVDGAGGNVGTPVAGSFGSVTINVDGSYTYALDDANPTVDGLAPGDTLTDSFNYSVSDGALTDSATLSVTIDGADDEPVAVDDSFTGVENTDCLLTTILDNDIDPDGGNLVGITDLPDVGSLHEVASDGSAGAAVSTGEQDVTEFCFVPEPFDYSNPPSEVYADFSYTLDPGGSTATVDLFIEPTPESNATPTADSQSLHAGENIDNDITLTGGDPDGDTLTFELVDAPDHGTVAGFPTIGATSATVTYTPDPDFTGNDSFTFATDDGIDTSAPATVSLDVAPVNTRPTIEIDGQALSGPGIEQPGTRHISVSADQTLNTVFIDPEALTPDGDAWIDFHFRMAIVEIPSSDGKGDPFEFGILDPAGRVDSTQARPDFENDDYGYLQWTASVAQSNALLEGFDITLRREGDFVLEIVVLDFGHTGVCPNDLEVPPPPTSEISEADIRSEFGREGDLIFGDPERCNRETVGRLTLTATKSSELTVTFAPVSP